MKTIRLLTFATLMAGTLTLSSGAFASTAAHVSVKNCVPAQLRVGVSRSQGAAGTIYYPLVITNVGATACAVWGVPGIQPVTRSVTKTFARVGPPARNTSMGEMPVRHVTQPHHSVSVAFGVTEAGNYPRAVCAPRRATGIEVSLGAFLRPTYIALRISVCTKFASTTTRLIVAGTSGN